MAWFNTGQHPVTDADCWDGHVRIDRQLAWFDQAHNQLLEQLGLGRDYRRATGCGHRISETRIAHRRAIAAGQTVTLRSALLSVSDAGLLGLHQLLDHAGQITAECELLLVHVDAKGNPCPQPTLRESARQARPTRFQSAITARH